MDIDGRVERFFLSPRSIRKIRNPQLFLDNGIVCAFVVARARAERVKKELRPRDLWVREA